MLTLRASSLLLLLLIPIALVILSGLRAAALGRQLRRAPELLLRCAALAVLVVAVAQPEWQRSSTHGSLTLLVDVSGSIAPADRSAEADWLQRAVAHASVDDPVTVVAFAATATATTLRAPVERGAIQALLRARADSRGTDLAGALRLAAGLSVPGSRLILLSDGVQTTGDATTALPDLAAQHLTLDTVLLGHRQQDTAITHLSLPAAVPAGTALPASITLTSTRAVTATLALRVDGQAIGSQALALQAGDNPYQIDLPAQAAGWHTVRASVTATGDARPENNALSAVTDVTRTPRVLLLAPQPASSNALAQLKDPSLSITATVPGKMPASSAKLSLYDAIVLDDLPATALSSA